MHLAVKKIVFKIIDIFFGTSNIHPSIVHDIGPLAQTVEQLAFNQLVARSNRARPTCPAGSTSAGCGAVSAPDMPGVVVKWFRNDSITGGPRMPVAAGGAVPEGDTPLISPPGLLSQKV